MFKAFDQNFRTQLKETTQTRKKPKNLRNLNKIHPTYKSYPAWRPRTWHPNATHSEPKRLKVWKFYFNLLSILKISKRKKYVQFIRFITFLTRLQRTNVEDHVDSLLFRFLDIIGSLSQNSRTRQILTKRLFRLYAQLKFVQLDYANFQILRKSTTLTPLRSLMLFKFLAKSKKNCLEKMGNIL